MMDFRWILGESRPSTAWLWRESAALNFRRCTSKRTSPGPPTLHIFSRRRNSAYTFSAGWKEQVSLPPSSPLSTGEPLRAYWPAASLSGMGSVVQQTARPSSGQWTQLQRSSVPLSPPSWTFSLHDAPVKLPVSWRTPPIPPTVSSSSYHQEDVPEHQSRLRQTAQQLFPPGCESPELKSLCHSLKPQYKPPTSWNMDYHPPPPAPKHPTTLPHHRNKLSETFLYNSKCAIQRKGCGFDSQGTHILTIHKCKCT